MKPYGNSRSDNLNCDWGCCPTKYVKAHFHHPERDIKEAIKRGRKKARQEARKEIREAQLSEDA